MPILIDPNTPSSSDPGEPMTVPLIDDSGQIGTATYSPDGDTVTYNYDNGASDTQTVSDDNW